MRDTLDIAADLLHCAESWEPDVRVMGNVRADEVAHLCRIILAINTMVEERKEKEEMPIKHEEDW